MKVKAAIEVKQFDEIINIAAVVSDAVSLLGDDTSGQEIPESDFIDDDWLNRFHHYAGAASSESLRHMWARILAGECKSAGAFGASAMRFIFELDTQLALQCQDISKRVLNDTIYISKDDKEGKALMNALALQAAGLINGVGGDITNTFSTDGKGLHNLIFGDVALQIKSSVNRKFNLPIWLITGLG